MFGRVLRCYTIYIYFRGLLPPDRILPGAKFTLRARLPCKIKKLMRLADGDEIWWSCRESKLSCWWRTVCSVCLLRAVGCLPAGGGQSRQYHERCRRSRRVVSRSWMVSGKDRRSRRSPAQATVGFPVSTVRHSVFILYTPFPLYNRLKVTVKPKGWRYTPWRSAGVVPISVP